MSNMSIADVGENNARIRQMGRKFAPPTTHRMIEFLFKILTFPEIWQLRNLLT